MHTRRVVAVFETPEAARMARYGLLELGLSPEQVTITDPSSAERTVEHPQGRGTFWAHIKEMFMPDRDRHTYQESLRRGSCVLVATVDDDRADEAIACLDRAGAIDLDQRESTWRSEGWNPAPDADRADDARRTATADADRDDDARRAAIADPDHADDARRTATADADRADDELRAAIPDPGRADDARRAAALSTAQTTMTAADAEGDLTNTQRTARRDELPEGGGRASIPVLEEHLRVGRREVNRGTVRVRSYIIEEPVHEEVRLREEHVNVERRPVDETTRSVAKGSPEDLLQERTIEVSETAEEAVVGKEARVREEVVVSKDVDERVEHIDDTVRRTKVEVEDGRQGNPNVRPEGSSKPPPQTRRT